MLHRLILFKFITCWRIQLFKMSKLSIQMLFLRFVVFNYSVQFQIELLNFFCVIFPMATTNPRFVAALTITNPTFVVSLTVMNLRFVARPTSSVISWFYPFLVHIDTYDYQRFQSFQRFQIIQDFKHSIMQEFKISGFQEFKNSRIQEFKKSRSR